MHALRSDQLGEESLVEWLLTWKRSGTSKVENLKSPMQLNNQAP